MTSVYQFAIAKMQENHEKKTAKPRIMRTTVRYAHGYGLYGSTATRRGLTQFELNQIFRVCLVRVVHNIYSFMIRTAEEALAKMLWNFSPRAHGPK